LPVGLSDDPPDGFPSGFFLSNGLFESLGLLPGFLSGI
jgi:hypothetical protein